MNKILRLNNLKTRTAINAKMSVFVICVEVIIHLLLYNLHNCTLKFNLQFSAPDLNILNGAFYIDRSSHWKQPLDVFYKKSPENFCKFLRKTPVS